MPEDIQEEIGRMRQEIDSLQIAVLGQKKKPWYRDFSLLLSTLALLFSFGTTAVSYHRTNVQDVQNTRQELRGLLQRMAALPKENAEVAKNYASDPAAVNMLAGYINEENSMLSRQAAETAKKLPKGTVSAVEYYGIGIGLGSSYDLEGEREFMRLSEETATDFNTEIAAIRTSAVLEFLSGHPEAGRTNYQRALNIFSKYPAYDDFTKSSANIATEVAWAYSEAGIGNLSGADQHVGSAEGILSKMPMSPGAERLRMQISQARQQIEMGGMSQGARALNPPQPPLTQ